MSNEAIKIRKEITKLKWRLAELEEDSDTTSLVCGHDVALENIKKLVAEQEQQGLCQITFFDHDWGWASTNLATTEIQYSDISTVTSFFTLLAEPKTWEILNKMFNKESVEIDDTMKKYLLQCNIIDEKGDFTQKGMLVYIAGGHVAYNVMIKLDTEKAFNIFQTVYSVTKTDIGSPIGISFKAFIELLKKNNLDTKLNELNITEKDLKDFYDQYYSKPAMG